MADEIGSLRAVKKIDTTVLSDDPLEIEPMALRATPVNAVIFEVEVA